MTLAPPPMARSSPADSRQTRRHWRHDAKEWADREVKAQRAYDDVVLPEEARLDHQINEIDDRVQELRQRQEIATAGSENTPRPPLDSRASTGN